MFGKSNLVADACVWEEDYRRDQGLAGAAALGHHDGDVRVQAE